MTIKIVCRSSKSRKNGLSPLELSITDKGDRTVMALDRQCKASLFNADTQKVRGDKALNEYIKIILDKCNDIQNEMIKRNINVTVDAFVDYYKNGFPDTNVTLLKYFDSHNKQYANKVSANSVSETSLYKYVQVKNRIASYLDSIGMNDINMADITPSWIEGFQTYCLKTLKNNTANKQLKMLKKIIVGAYNDGIISSNPFKLTLREEKLEYHPLSLTDINKLINKDFDNDRLSKVRDLFVFQCYTGLSYADMATLTKDNIVDGVIIKNRKKTDIKSVIPLLDVAVEILERYDYHLPILTNQKYNAYLAEIKTVCGIKQKLHTHLGRHTYATILINNGIELPVIAKILGHSTTKTTERIYAQMLDTTVVDNADKIRQAFSI